MNEIRNMKIEMEFIGSKTELLEFIDSVYKRYKDTIPKFKITRNGTSMIYLPDFEDIRPEFSSGMNNVVGIANQNHPKAIEIIREKMEKNGDLIDLDFMDYMGRTALICAVQHRNFYLVKMLLAEGCDPNLWKYKCPVKIACMNKDYKMVELLLRHGADPNAQSGPKDFSPLMNAVQLEDIELCATLLENGAKTTSPVSSEEKHALIYALETGNEELIELLKEAKRRGL